MRGEFLVKKFANHSQKRMIKSPDEANQLIRLSDERADLSSS
jgi:hypothetical protein